MAHTIHTPLAAADADKSCVATPDKILRLEQTKAVSGHQSTSSLYAHIAAGNFPKPIKISAKSVGWLESEIIEWQKQRIAERDARIAERRSAAKPSSVSAISAARVRDDQTRPSGAERLSETERRRGGPRERSARSDERETT